MLIIWGTKIVRRRRGNTAIFCAICRGVRQAELLRVSRAPHIYFIPTGSGTHLHNEAVCEECRTVQALAKGSIERDAASPEFGLRLAQEERALTQRLDPAERFVLLAEPFAALRYEYELKMVTGAGRSLTSVLQAIALGSLAVALVITGIYFQETRPNSRAGVLPWMIGGWLACAATGSLAAYQTARAGGVLVRTRILPRIAKSLSLLDPTLEELESVLEAHRREGNPIAKAATAAELRQAIEMAQLGR